ncbi:TetR family transcriptional regulator [Brevibacterium luteolum]|uniref:TetR family transcriptional regulator n=1 Tax=Brevibacterium luteolum TaxID=199591 RepID=UPI0021AFDF89|nr:TetR family transcriptional regulator [Brevibacterium luteolum]MCT1657251.1 TetR family transcriptional regulator [Brevibacterium luteolum]MCT1873300.1 TetR family transcriptional regulator [Brevibacterium luteolum]MCT1889895.1 TetR family transcriptional regulator [Brevibacterium luteolum]MCT1892297.1 TetR family transcriptional regulator [Brevibacterium luteolum]MCT1923626.1 TetR family transcriptional regulator [Brevibacterium luteolum]
MALSQQAIIDTSLRILSRFGMGDLSMRRLARELDVQPSALYWHVKNKQDLFVLLARQMLAAAVAEADGTEAADLAWALRTVLLRYRDGAEIYALGLALEGDELIPEPIRERGGETLMDYIVGALIIEQHRTDFDRQDPAAGARFKRGVSQLL